MKPITYREIDTVLRPWAKAHRLQIYTECKGEEIRSMRVVNKNGDQYGIYAIPDWENNSRTIAVGSDLHSRGKKKHTFYRERKKYHFRKSVEFSDLKEGLNEAWGKINKWMAEPEP